MACGVGREGGTIQWPVYVVAHEQKKRLSTFSMGWASKMTGFQSLRSAMFLSSRWYKRSSRFITRAQSYYSILGVSRTASKSEIESAFGKLAGTYFSEYYKNPEAEQNFVEVCDAYKVLSDDELRSVYDRYGEAGLGASRGKGVLLFPYNILESTIMQKRGRGEGEDTNIYSHKISYLEAILGTTVTVPTLEGSIELEIPPGTQSGTILGLAENSAVRVEVEIPEQISDEERKILEELRDQNKRKSPNME